MGLPPFVIARAGSAWSLLITGPFGPIGIASSGPNYVRLVSDQCLRVVITEEDISSWNIAEYSSGRPVPTMRS